MGNGTYWRTTLVIFCFLTFHCITSGRFEPPAWFIVSASDGIMYSHMPTPPK